MTNINKQEQRVRVSCKVAYTNNLKYAQAVNNLMFLVMKNKHQITPRLKEK